ncbi:MAG: MATE family efflux transporter [Prevotella sp.]|nr:MATE family efflux transporter [Staphylococcus sp.]MCM1349777.1 MATE family efflux transporter [Prevotella sp.]
MKDKSFLILKDKNIIKGILILALPIMFSNILKSVHDIVDMYFIGHMNESQEVIQAQVSAITLTGPILQICQALALGLMIAGTAIISQYLGGEEVEKAKNVSGQLIILSIALGFFFNFSLYLLAPQIIKWMGATLDTPLYQYAVKYVQYRSFELTGLFLFYAYQAIRQSTGDTITPVLLNMVSVALNILLTALFILRFHMQINGAALATVIGNIFIMPFCILLMIRRKHNPIPFRIKDLKLNFTHMRQLFRVGLPAALSQAFTSLGFLLINSLIIGFPAHIVYAIGIGNRINSLLLFPTMSIGSVLATFIGQNIGALQVERAKQSLKYAMFITLVISIGGTIILLWCRKPLVRFFIDEAAHQQAFQFCVYYLYFLLMTLPLMGVFQVWTGCFQGAGKTGYSLLLATMRLWVFRLPLIWVMMRIFKMGPPSIYYAMVISNFGAVILGTFLYCFIDFKPNNEKRYSLLKQAKV